MQSLGKISPSLGQNFCDFGQIHCGHMGKFFANLGMLRQLFCANLHLYKPVWAVLTIRFIRMQVCKLSLRINLVEAANVSRITQSFCLAIS